MYHEFEASPEVSNLLNSHDLWKQINRNMIVMIAGCCITTLLVCLLVEKLSVAFFILEGALIATGVILWIVSFYLYRKRMIQAYKQAQLEEKMANLPYIIGSDPD